ncbi:hypothetical protein AB0O68_34990, partial [Streptomyces sp. NPDC087512]|uniref:hypothetical protein n=1 Tax=Streptomyces sp. NPDC087512 TaxID=3155059 RepID=UPI003437665B
MRRINVWYTADVEWLLYGSAVSDDGESALSVACLWRMKILFSTDEKDESPTILSGAPCLPDTADGRCMSVVRSLRQAAERLASRVTGSLTSKAWLGSYRFGYVAVAGGAGTGPGGEECLELAD